MWQLFRSPPRVFAGAEDEESKDEDEESVDTEALLQEESDDDESVRTAVRGAVRRRNRMVYKDEPESPVIHLPQPPAPEVPRLKWSKGVEENEIHLSYPLPITSDLLHGEALDPHGFSLAGRFVYTCLSVDGKGGASDTARGGGGGTRSLDDDCPSSSSSSDGVIPIVPGTTILFPGVYQLSCLFIPADNSRYVSIKRELASVLVEKGQCVVSYSAPPTILVKGAALTDEYFQATVVTAAEAPRAFAPTKGLRRRDLERQQAERRERAAQRERMIISGEIKVTEEDLLKGEAEDDEACSLVSLGSSVLSEAGNYVDGQMYYSHQPGDVLSQGVHTLIAKFEPAQRHLFNYAYARASVKIAAPEPRLQWIKAAPLPFSRPLGRGQLKVVVHETPPPDVCSRHYKRRCKICTFALRAEREAARAQKKAEAEAEAEERAKLNKARGVVGAGDEQQEQRRDGQEENEKVEEEEEEEEEWEGFGKILYDPPAGTILPVGSHILRASFQSHDLEKYSHASISSTITVVMCRPDYIWATPPPLYEENGLDRRHLAAGTDPEVEGQWSFDPPFGTALPLGKHTIVATFTPADDTSYLPIGDTREVVCIKRKPVILYWSTPKPLVYPAPLTRGQLCASASTAGARGEFLYDPPLGSVLPAGANRLTVTFRSDNMALAHASAEVILTVLPGKPRIVWNAPTPLIEGEILQELTLSAKCENAPGGKFQYDPPLFSQLLEGSHRLRCRFVPREEDEGNWEEAAAEVTLEVTKRQKRRTQLVWDPPAPIKHPAKLSALQCNATCRQCDGTFFYFPQIGTILDAGEHNLRVKFQPSERNKYAPSEAMVKLEVTRGEAKVFWKPTKTRIPYGEPIRPDMLCATSDAVGTIVYEPEAGVILPSGCYELKATIVPNKPDNYSPAHAYATLEVTRHTPILHWDPLEPVTFPTILDGSFFLPRLVFPRRCDLPESHPLFSAVDNSPLFPDAAVQGMRDGTFSFSHKQGQVLPAGRHQLSCRYMPRDTACFFSAEAAVWLKVDRGRPFLFNWNPQQEITYGLPLEEESHLNAVYDLEPHLVDVTYDPPAGHVFDCAGVKTLTVTITPKDKDNYDPLVAVRYISVVKTNPPLVWPQPAPIGFGTPLGPKQLCAGLNLSLLTPLEQQELQGGTFAYKPPLGSFVKVGELNVLSVVFTPPASSVNFKESDALRVILKVMRAAPKISVNPVKAITYGERFDGPRLIKPSVGANLPGAFTFTVPHGHVCPPGKQRVGIDFIPNDPNNMLPAAYVHFLDVYRAQVSLSWPAFDVLRTVPSGYRLTKQDLNAVALGIVLAPEAKGKEEKEKEDGGQRQRVQGQFFYTPPLGSPFNVPGMRELRVDFVLAAEAAAFYSQPQPYFVKVCVK